MQTNRSLPLLWNTQASATIYLFLPEAGLPTITAYSGARCRVTLQSPDGASYAGHAAASPIATSARKGPAGVWTVTVTATPAEAAPVPTSEANGITPRTEVPLWIESDIGYPFVVCGPGIVPSHLPEPEPILKLNAARRDVDVWLWAPSSLDVLSLQSNFSGRPLAHLVAPDDTEIALTWEPPTGNYCATEVKISHHGWWRLPVSRGCVGELAAWEGVPMFAEKVPDLPQSHLEVRVVDARNNPVAARVELWRGARRWAIRDTLAGEPAAFHTPPGDVQIRVSRGFAALPRIEGIRLDEGHQSLQIVLEDSLIPPAGWVCGDHHVHSYCEDGGQSPEAVVRAAAAQGLDYVFLTDEPEPILQRDLQKYNVPGTFLALPGQECFNPEVHCNALNIYEALPVPRHGTEAKEYPGPREWLAGIQRQSERHPALLMLNHPAHVPGTMDKQPYFYSWNQADAHLDILLVENFDFESWFARLNSGRRITAIWTTDGHDMAWVPAGRKRSYVYVGNEGQDRAKPWTDTDIVAGLAKGAVINTRHPGALLFLTVEGAIPGDQVKSDGDPVTVRVECRSTRPLRKVELVVGGEIYARWPGHHALSFQVSASFALPTPGWVLARAYVYEEPRPRDGHSNEPLTASECVAFTNPVYLG